MRVLADLHIHSRFSRACSDQLNVPNLARWAKLKGINLLGTGDFTHPLWLRELKERLSPLDNGLYEYGGTRFVLTSEIATVWSVERKVKRVHTCLCAPSIEVVEQINEELAKRGNLSNDGRPVLGMSAAELVEIVMQVSPDCFVYPAHAWTPWFSVFGSMSGFDSIEDCYEDRTKDIFALETGLSSDPRMNWRLSALDRYTLLSNSDSHSLQKIGREANVFELDESFSYLDVINAIKLKDPKRFRMTVEFFPEEGKYHYDGHRACGVSMHPRESRKINNICPVCRHVLTIGVLNRVEQLADREEGVVPSGALPYVKLVPLQEIIVDTMGRGWPTRAVMGEYEKLIGAFGTEFDVLTGAPKDKLFELTDEKIAEGIMRVREGRVAIEPGYDGVYGRISILGEKEKPARSAGAQSSLSEFV